MTTGTIVITVAAYCWWDGHRVSEVVALADGGHDLTEDFNVGRVGGEQRP